MSDVPPNQFRFLKEVSLGQVIQIFVLVMGVVIYGLRLEGQLRIVELRITVQEKRMDELQHGIDEKLGDIKESIKSLWSRRGTNP